MNENKFVKFIIISIITLIILLSIFIAYLFTTSSDKISETFNSLVSTVTVDTKVSNSEKSPNDEVNNAIANTVSKTSALDLLFDNIENMSDDQYIINEEILLNCGIDNIKNTKLLEQTDLYTSYRIHQDTIKYVVLDVYFNNSNDIIKIKHYDTVLFEDGQYFYVSKDFAIQVDTLNLYKNAILEMSKREYASSDVSFYIEEISPYYIVTNPDVKSITVYGHISVDDKNIIKKFEANFTADNMDTITFFNYIPK